MYKQANILTQIHTKTQCMHTYTQTDIASIRQDISIDMRQLFWSEPFVVSLRHPNLNQNIFHISLLEQFEEKISFSYSDICTLFSSNVYKYHE